MKILFLTQYYPPEMGAPPARINETAVRLQKLGNEITVITAFPSRPMGTVYPGYRNRWSEVFDENGIKVIRNWIKPSSASASFLSRMVNDLSFSFSSVMANLFRLGKQDVVVVQNPPIFSGISGFLLSVITRAKLVMWCGDVWPDVLLESGELKDGILAKVMKCLQQFLFSRSSLLAVTTPVVSERIQSNYSCPPTVVWSNGVDTQLFHPEKRDVSLRNELGCRDTDMLFGYVGLHGRFQGLESVVTAATRIRDIPNFEFVLVGDGVEKEKLKEIVRKSNCSHIRFLDGMPKSEMPRLVASCDVAVVSLQTRMPGTMPSKFYEACASGTVPFTADGCEAAKLVEASGCGELYEPGDVDSAERVFRKMLKYGSEEKGSKRNACRELALRFDRDYLAGYVNECIDALCSNEELPTQAW